MNKQLSDNYKEKLKQVTMPGVNEQAWDYETLMAFLSDDESNLFAILGGDVLIQDSQQEMSYTYDNWGADSRKIGESFSDYSKRCKQLTIDYLNKYPVKKENLFILVMTSEVTAGMNK